MEVVYFISGHRNLSREEFLKAYKDQIDSAMSNPNSKFVLAECEGVDSFAQDYLRDHLKNHKRVTVYHMFDSPRYLASKLFNTKGGYKTDIERDTAMTIDSNIDIAFIHKGAWTSGTAQNILRRYEKL